MTSNCVILDIQSKDRTENTIPPHNVGVQYGTNQNQYVDAIAVVFKVTSMSTSTTTSLMGVMATWLQHLHVTKLKRTWSGFAGRKSYLKTDVAHTRLLEIQSQYLMIVAG